MRCSKSYVVDRIPWRSHFPCQCTSHGNRTRVPNIVDGSEKTAILWAFSRKVARTLSCVNSQSRHLRKTKSEVNSSCGEVNRIRKRPEIATWVNWDWLTKERAPQNRQSQNFVSVRKSVFSFILCFWLPMYLANFENYDLPKRTKDRN